MLSMHFDDIKCGRSVQGPYEPDPYLNLCNSVIETGEY